MYVVLILALSLRPIGSRFKQVCALSQYGHAVLADIAVTLQHRLDIRRSEKYKPTHFVVRNYALRYPREDCLARDAESLCYVHGF
ncbi:MAG: hypothetical protein QOH88_3223 [Verrucomicrobiota bacterium]|jgi:hypothetical protein